MDLGPNCARCGHAKDLHKSFASQRWCLGSTEPAGTCECDLYVVKG